MAKKKATQQAKDTTKHHQNQENEPTNTTAQTNSEKLESLKSLNSMLLKETVERRQQTESLEQERCVLEAELTQSALQKRALEDELRSKSESLEVERDVLGVFVRAQMRELSEELSLVAGRLREKEFVERELEEAVRDVERLRRRVEGIVREKEVVEVENEGMRLKVGELEVEVGKLSGVVQGLRKEEAVLRGVVSELERSCEECVEREKGMEKEISDLGEERKGMERDLLGLNEEKFSILSELDRSEVELREKVRRVSELIEEKNEVEKLKANKESEIFELKTEVGSLRDVISKLQDSCRGQMEKNDQLTEEVCEFRGVVGRITVERDDARKGYDDEKEKGTELRSRVIEMEKKVGDYVEELERAKAERDELVKMNIGNGSRVEKLVGEKDVLLKKLNEAERKITEMKGRIELVSLNSENTLTLLKEAAAFLGQCKGKERGNGGRVLSKGKISEDLQPYANELEAMKKVFVEKETKIEVMKQQVELLQNSVADAQKRKSFWTIVSSVTTLFAAASVAFAATGR